ncbi:MAG: SH3 domain-containing protein, partial [Anaerolineales bacterium]|nr:SH3 domain-containing protein [Anaerolineales bacterium]
SMTPAPPATATITPTPSVTSTPTVTPTPSATPTPIPMQITAEAAFLRAGPGVNYKIIAFPLQGAGVTAVARNSDATWYNVILEDDTSGWIYNDVVRPDDTAVGPTLPLAATIPAPLNEFYDFSAQDNGNTLVVQVYHVYVGTRGEDAFLRARLLPETDQVQPSYLNGDDLGLGLRIVAFSRTGSAPYTSTGVEFCMVDTTGEAFYCQTFPIRKEW